VSVVANVAINVDSRNAVSNLRQVQTQAGATERAFGALQSAIGALGAGFALTKVIADVKELDTNLRRLGTVGVDVGVSVGVLVGVGVGTVKVNVTSESQPFSALYKMTLVELFGTETNTPSPVVNSL
jgi:uncharacterized membrane protein YidH (DUF202 family)